MGVVVGVFQAAVHDGFPVVVQDGHVVPRAGQELGEEAKVDGQHLGDENGVLFPHLLGKEQAASLVVF